MQRTRNIILAICIAALAASSFAAPPPAATQVPQIDIPYTKTVLPNGLTLLVHEDHKAPVVAVNVWYHVGSKNEKPGRTGFAHLFEHLMFNGSENFNDDYFKVLERVGATDLNGTTNEDRTNYFQNVPTSAIDLTLWMESDRMGHLVGALDQAKLDEQRGVVQNEKRQGDNEPYAIADELITKACFPAGHPYSWTVIGSMEDLDAARLDDVKEWFRNYYGPANAVLVVAGDIDTKTAVEKATKYFGDIPSGPPVARFESWVAKRSGVQRQSATDRVPQARVYMVWNTPGWGTADATYLDLLSDVMTSGKSSRLYKRLVYDDQIATDVNAYYDLREIAGLFVIRATARPGGDLSKIESAIDEEMTKLLATGPTQFEVDRVRTQNLASFIRGAERIGGFGGKSDILARSQVFGGSPDAYRASLQRVATATPANLLEAGKKWLSDGVYILDITPFPKYTTASEGADRKTMPKTGEPPSPAFPKMERATLPNGMKLIVAERHTVPTVNLMLMLDAGYAADQSATPGTASLAMDMLDEGTKTHSALEISDQLAMLGATLRTGSDLDESVVRMSALSSNLDPSLAIFSDVILNPAFPQADFERLQKQQIAMIQREKAQPIPMGLRVFPKILYGVDHAYGNPLTGSGTEASVAAMKRSDLETFHRNWFRPNNATLVVVGDTTLAAIQPKIQKLFSGWKSGDVPKKHIGTVSLAPAQAVYLIDKPGAQQSIVFAGHVSLPKANPHEIAIETMNTVLGGAFISRLNMNLREDKHWSYGAGSFLWGARGQRPFIAYSPVQTDKTKESMMEISKELNDITSTRPVTNDEVAMAQSNLILQLPGSWETSGEVLNAIGDLVRYGLPDDYYATYPGAVKALTQKEVAAAAGEAIHPKSL
ncbi:MAG: pitrilysin family protein, partial [Thermoanaerobaculia bacterium]